MFDETNLQHTDCYNFQCNDRQSSQMLATVTVMFAVLLAGILQCVERSESLCSNIPCDNNPCVTVCERKFPPTISKHCPHQDSALPKTILQFETPSIPALVISQDSVSSVQHHCRFCSQQQQYIVWRPFISAEIQKS